MMSEESVQELQIKKRELQSKLSNLLETRSSKDDINELKSEILHIDKLIEKKVGTKELKRQEEVRRRKTGKEELAIKTYLAFKGKYKKISEMTVATNRLLSVIDSLDKEFVIERVKVKV